MDQEETFEALREILPELEVQLRQSILSQYQQQLKKTKQYYEGLIEEQLSKKQRQMKAEMQRNQTQLRKEICLMQRERQQWLSLEKNYRKTIFQLTQKLKDGKNEDNISALTQITPKNISLYHSKQKSQAVGQWKKRKSVVEFKIAPNTLTSKKSIVQENKQVDAFNQGEGSIFQNLREEQNLLEQRPLRVDKINEGKTEAWKTSKRNMPSEEEFKMRGQRQDTMVLSPPKSEQKHQMRSSMLLPPSGTSMKSSILKKEQGKKKLMQMIRNIK